MSKMNLPTHYAQKLMPSKGRIWPVKTLGLSEFCSVLQEKEPIMVNLFNSLGVSKCGTLQRENLRDSLKRAGLVATEANITSMMKFMGASANGSIKYGQFRKFMMLIPTDELNLNPW
jgi:Ca2+-binding EF-hand superfamily protein